MSPITPDIELRIPMRPLKLGGRHTASDAEIFRVGPGAVYLTDPSASSYAETVDIVKIPRKFAITEIFSVVPPFAFRETADGVEKLDLTTGVRTKFGRPFSCHSQLIAAASPQGYVIGITPDADCFDFFSESGTSIISCNNIEDAADIFEVPDGCPPFWHTGASILSLNSSGFVAGGHPGEFVFHYMWSGKLIRKHSVRDNTDLTIWHASLNETHLALSDGGAIDLIDLRTQEKTRFLIPRKHYGDHLIISTPSLFHLDNLGRIWTVTKKDSEPAFSLTAINLSLGVI